MFTRAQKEKLAREHFPLIEQVFYTNFPSFYGDPDQFLSDGALGLMRGLDKYDDSKPGTLSTFLYTCILNKMRDTVRKISRRPKTFSLIRKDAPVPSHEFDVENREYVDSLLSRLPERKSTLIAMRYLKGYTLEEIRYQQGFNHRTTLSHHLRETMSVLRRMTG